MSGTEGTVSSGSEEAQHKLKRQAQAGGGGAVQPPASEAGNRTAVPSRVARNPQGGMPPETSLGDGPEVSLGDRSETTLGDGSENSPPNGPGSGIPDGPEDGPQDSPEDGSPDSPEDRSPDGPDYRTPGDPGGVGLISRMLMRMRWLGPFFGLAGRSHIGKLLPPRKTWVLARKTS
jgi:hypothetical protein